ECQKKLREERVLAPSPSDKSSRYLASRSASWSHGAAGVAAPPARRLVLGLIRVSRCSLAALVGVAGGTRLTFRAFHSHAVFERLQDPAWSSHDFIAGLNTAGCLNVSFAGDPGSDFNKLHLVTGEYVHAFQTLGLL